MPHANCPTCGVPFALVGRAHRCVPRPAPVAETVTHTVPEQVAAEIASENAVGIVEKLDSKAEAVTALEQGSAEVARLVHTQEVAGSNPAPATNVVSITTARKPKRDRAKYMRDYRRRQKAKKVRVSA